MNERASPRPLMQCGHSANATATVDGVEVPACAICFNTKVVTTPVLEGRFAQCAYCKRLEPSSTDLAFFEFRFDSQLDSFYDGCRGWD